MHRGHDTHESRFGGPNWLDRRQSVARFADADPVALVVGGGQAGIAAAARLGQLGVSTLVVDRLERVGDNWRKRYHSLVLHNEVWVNHLPYQPFPRHLADLRAQGQARQLVRGVRRQHGDQLLDGPIPRRDLRHRGATLGRAGAIGYGVERELRPRHIVLATGVSGMPNIPELPGIADFNGVVEHSSRYTDGSRYAGKRVLVMGSGNSGHDVAQDLHASGATVTMVQRSATTVTSVGPDAAGRVYSIYREGLGTEDADLLSVSVAYPQMRRAHQLITADLFREDADLISGLEAAGFRVDAGEDGTGFQLKYLRRGGGYYLNVGCSELIVNGSVRVVQNADIDTFQRDGVRLVDGSVIEADAVIMATGYLPQQELVRRLFGTEIADAVGPIWGYGEEGELRNMWKRTAQPGLWFTAGSLAQCRIFSRFLALQIRASEDGLLDPAADGGIPSGRLRPADLTDAIPTENLVAEAAR